MSDNSARAEARSLVALEVSHRRTSLDVRERLSFSSEACATLGAALADGRTEAVVLSTCNRTEVYLAAADPDEAAARSLDALAEAAGTDATAIRDVFERHGGEAAAVHLVRVAAGLESAVVGEPQILGQVRAAYDAARGARSTGTVLNRLFEHAIRAGRAIRRDAGLSEVHASVPAAAAELARTVLPSLERARIVMIGAGKMAQLAASNLSARGAEKIFVANHTPAKAAALAERFGGEAVAFDAVAEELRRADLVVSSTRCPELLVTQEDVRNALPHRNGRALVFVDLSVPRDVDPGVADLSGCSVFDIDDLAEYGAATDVDRDRLSEADRAAKRHAAEFESWRRSRAAAPTIASLRRRAEEIRAAELARHEATLAGLAPAERRAVETVTTQIVNKLLHSPTVRAREAAAGDDPNDADALKRLFALD